MSKRNLRDRSGPQSRGNARNNFRFHSYLAQCGELFPSPAKNERVPTLQPNDLQSQQRVLNQEAIDLLLRRASHAAALAYINALGTGWNQRASASKPTTSLLSMLWPVFACGW